MIFAELYLLQINVVVFNVRENTFCVHFPVLRTDESIENKLNRIYFKICIINSNNFEIEHRNTRGSTLTPILRHDLTVQRRL